MTVGNASPLEKGTVQLFFIGSICMQTAQGIILESDGIIYLACNGTAIISAQIEAHKRQPAAIGVLGAAINGYLGYVRLHTLADSIRNNAVEFVKAAVIGIFGSASAS
jgi:hypothetical protein